MEAEAFGALGKLKGGFMPWQTLEVKTASFDHLLRTLEVTAFGECQGIHSSYTLTIFDSRIWGGSLARRRLYPPIRVSAS